MNLIPFPKLRKNTLLLIVIVCLFLTLLPSADARSLKSRRRRRRRRRRAAQKHREQNIVKKTLTSTVLLTKTLTNHRTIDSTRTLRTTSTIMFTSTTSSLTTQTIPPNYKKFIDKMRNQQKHLESVILKNQHDKLLFDQQMQANSSMLQLQKQQLDNEMQNKTALLTQQQSNINAQLQNLQNLQNRLSERKSRLDREALENAKKPTPDARLQHKIRKLQCKINHLIESLKKQSFGQVSGNGGDKEWRNRLNEVIVEASQRPAYKRPPPGSIVMAAMLKAGLLALRPEKLANDAPCNIDEPEVPTHTSIVTDDRKYDDLKASISSIAAATWASPLPSMTFMSMPTPNEHHQHHHHRHHSHGNGSNENNNNRHNRPRSTEVKTEFRPTTSFLTVSSMVTHTDKGTLTKTATRTHTNVVTSTSTV